MNLFKRDSMREPPQLGNEYLFTRFIGDLSNVKMSLTWGQSAWVLNPSETTRRAFSSAHSFSNRNNFNNWLVGFTDGDGSFYFAKTSRGTWTFAFQIAQSTYNLRVLYFIKSQIKLGSINIHEKTQMAVFRIRNKAHLLEHVIPIFEKHLLLTSKYFKFKCFKKALMIHESPELSKEKKDILIARLKMESSRTSQVYRSPVWKNYNSPLCSKHIQDIRKILSKSWLVGFIEAEGSFYIVKKDAKRLAHAFELTQVLDCIVLEAIAVIFDLKVTQKKTYNTIVTTNSSKIQMIAAYFFKTMKGMKAIEYRIWARSFAKKRGNFEALFNIREQMRSIRSIRFGKHFKRLK